MPTQLVNQLASALAEHYTDSLGGNQPAPADARRIQAALEALLGKRAGRRLFLESTPDTREFLALAAAVPSNRTCVR